MGGVTIGCAPGTGRERDSFVKAGELDFTAAVHGGTADQVQADSSPEVSP